MLLTQSVLSFAQNHYPHEFPLNKLEAEFRDGVVISEYRRCRDKVAKNFRPEKLINNKSIMQFRGHIHGTFFECLKDVRRTHPLELEKMVFIQKEYEESYFNRMTNKLDDSFYEKVNSGLRFQDCSKEVRKNYPQYYLYKPEAYYDKYWGGSICRKYKNFLESIK